MEGKYKFVGDMIIYIYIYMTIKFIINFLNLINPFHNL